MKTLIITISIIVLFFCNIYRLEGQDITFHHLTTDEGLSQISVLSLYQDELGFIWIGTREGLNRYDNNSITTYKLQKNNNYSLFSNNILKVTGDRKGKIFILTTEGVCEYDLKSDRFSTLWKDIDILTIYYYNDKLFVGKGSDIYVLSTDENKFEHYYHLPIKGSKISTLHFDDEGALYIGTSNRGLYVLNTEQSLSNPITNNCNITSIYQDSEGIIWVGSWENGLFMLTDDGITNFEKHVVSNRGVSSNFVRSCCEDNQGNIWIGTFNGLDKYNKKTGVFSHYNTSNEPDGLTHSSIWCIIKDHQGTLWLGTYFGGVNYFNPEYEIYTWYKPSLTEKSGLSSPIIGRMIEDKYKNLWICTEGGGVNLYDRKKKTFKWYTSDSKKNSISENNVKAIYYDKDKDLMWFGTHLGGLNKLDLTTDKFTHYRYNRKDSSSILSDIVRDIEPYKGKLILATYNGVCLFNPETGKSTQLFENIETRALIKNVFDIYVDNSGILWISVIGEGIFAYNLETKEIKNYRHNPIQPNSISNNNINSITEDRNNNFYFSTSGRGLDMLRPRTNIFTNFDLQNNGLSSDCVYNVRESNKGKILVITNLGFSIFDPDTKQFHNYNMKNGFPLSTVNENAVYQTSDGEIFLGGVKGLVSFYETDLNFSHKPYGINFTRLFINGKEVKVNDNTSILKKSLSFTSSLILQSNHSTIGIEFATSNYIPANHDKIIYRLEGFSDEWNTTHDQNLITYTNLNAGDYKLILKNDIQDVGYNQEVTLLITVLPPFYKSTLAYIIYALMLLTILYFIIRAYKSKVKLEASLEYEQRHLQDIEQLNQMKLRFFTNISHEFRTPLTLIIGQLESLLQNNQIVPVIYNKILGVYKNSLQLKELISELLDFRKQELGHVKLLVTENNIVEFLKDSYRRFEEYAVTKRIKFTLNVNEDIINVWYDAKQIQKVINNLLSNAFKYTNTGDSIWINVTRNDTYAVFEVGDSGVGIKKEEISLIFDQFYQGEDINSIRPGTGIGLALAKSIVELHGGTISVESFKGEGTVFSIALKLGKEHFDPALIDESDIPNIASDDYDIPVSVLPDDDNLVVEPYLGKSRKMMKILIVEDEQSLIRMLAEIFSPFYQIVTAENGEEGLTMLKSEQPDIVLSDVLMPKMNGIELCKAIKSNIDTCHIPVVLLTAKVAVEHNLEGLRFGADDYIAKPFNITLLLQRCNNLINSRIMLQEKFSKQPLATPQMLATNFLDKSFLDDAIAIIERNMENPEFSVNEFAAEIGMSRSKLFTKLKGVTGQSPNNFVMTIRLKKAALLLKSNPELSVSDISAIVGFSSSRYFSKCFKDEYHLTPMAYRNETTDNDD